MARPKKTQLESMSQLDGMAEKEEFVPTTIAQVLGDNGLYKYGTMDQTEYQGMLENMNKADLQSHAAKNGLIPIDDRARLIKRLTHEFALHIAQYRRPNVQSSDIRTLSPEVAKILAGGR